MSWYVAIFFLTAHPGTPVGPAVYGGSTLSECRAYAAQLIRNIKHGSEIVGAAYRPLGFKCEQHGGRE